MGVKLKLNLRWLPTVTMLKRTAVRYGSLIPGFIRYDHETVHEHYTNSGDYEKVNMLPKISVAMVTRHFKNGCIFAVFL